MPITSTTPVVTATQFRTDYPEFKDANKYPDSSINYWLAVATLLLNTNRWNATILILGTELYVAHNLVLEAEAQDQAKANGWPGLSKGVINSESAGAVTVSYDTEPALEKDAGHWNLTKFGTRFIKLARQAGAGPIYVGSDCSPAGTITGAWSGPLIGY